MPRARFTSPYFGDGMNNLVAALAGDPLQDVQAGLLGDRRKLTQAQQRESMAQALLGELEHTRTVEDDRLAQLAAPNLTGIDSNLANLVLRGGGDTNQRASGANTLLGANAALTGNPYMSLNLQGKMPDEDYSPSATRADAVSARNADESYREEMDTGRLSELGDLAQALIQEDGRDSRAAATGGRTGTPLNVNATQLKHLRELTGAQLQRRLEERGMSADDPQIAGMVDQLVDYASYLYQDTRDAGAAINMVLDSLFTGGHIEGSPPKQAPLLGFEYGGGDPNILPSWSEFKAGEMNRQPTAGAGMPGAAGGGQNEMLNSILLALTGGEGLPPTPQPTQAAAPQIVQEQPAPLPVVEPPQAAAPPPVTPIADALTAGVGQFPPAPTQTPESFAANPANRNLSHPGQPGPEILPVVTPQDKQDALTAAAEALAQGGNGGSIMMKLGMMGFSEQELQHFRETLARHGIQIRGQ